MKNLVLAAAALMLTCGTVLAAENADCAALADSYHAAEGFEKAALGDKHRQLGCPAEELDYMKWLSKPFKMPASDK